MRGATPDGEVEALAARAASLSPAEAEALCAGDVLVLGGIADRVRREGAGDAVTLVRVHALPWDGHGEPPPPPSEPPDEVRLGGPLPDGATLSDARATLARVREAFPGVPVRGVRPLEAAALARAAELPPRVVFSRLADAGLATPALPSPADDPAESFDLLLAARGAGLEVDAPVPYAGRSSPGDLARALLRVRAAPGLPAGFRCAVPLPDSLPEQSPLTGTTGLLDLRVLACARILLPAPIRVAAEADLLGRKLAAVALSFGADTLAGTLCVATGRIAPADAERPRPFSADRARLLLLECGRPAAAPPPFPERAS